jgi:transformation/transcription domain-associated protein
MSHYLTEFQYNKVDEIEVFGQYTEVFNRVLTFDFLLNCVFQDKDNNTNFVKIQKFDNKVENCRSAGMAWKRLTMYGHDNSKVSFSIQLPTHRHARREEKVMQTLRTFNT